MLALILAKFLAQFILLSLVIGSTFCDNPEPRHAQSSRSPSSSPSRSSDQDQSGGTCSRSSIRGGRRRPSTKRRCRVPVAPPSNKKPTPPVRQCTPRVVNYSARSYVFTRNDCKYELSEEELEELRKIHLLAEPEKSINDPVVNALAKQLAKLDIDPFADRLEDVRGSLEKLTLSDPLVVSLQKLFAKMKIDGTLPMQEDQDAPVELLPMQEDQDAPVELGPQRKRRRTVYESGKVTICGPLRKRKWITARRPQRNKRRRGLYEYSF